MAEEELLIGGVLYRVVRDYSLEERTGRWGEVDHKASKIRIEGSLLPGNDIWFVTILHEALHAVLVQHGITNEVEDHIIDYLAFALLNFARNNKEFLRVMLLENKASQ